MRAIHDLQHMSSLELHFPHIVEKIALLWGYSEMDMFFERLLIDTRGDRAGFPPEVLSELIFLSTFHLQVFPPKARFGAVNKRDPYQFALG